MNINLVGKRAFVGGSSQGIGLASAQLLAEAGASVVLTARNEKDLQEAIKTLAVKDETQKHDLLVIDYADPKTAESTVSEYISLGNNIDILINNSGGPAPAPLITEGADKITSTFVQHVVSSQLIAQAVVHHMKRSGWGRIINIISTSVKTPLPGLGVSNIVRGAMASWSKTLAGELAPLGITVNNVLPGSTATARMDKIIAADAEKTGKSLDEVTRLHESQIPMQRFGKPEEVAAAVLFLASQSASYITGINIPVDGGRTPCL